MHVAERMNATFLDGSVGKTPLMIIHVIESAVEAACAQFASILRSDSDCMEQSRHRVQRCLASDSTAADVLLCLFVGASRSKRRMALLSPFPPMFVTKQAQKDLHAVVSASLSCRFARACPSTLSFCRVKSSIACRR